MRTFTLLVGMCGSGKTTLVRKLIKRYGTIVSPLDKWPMLHGRFNNWKNNVLVVGRYKKGNLSGGADYLQRKIIWKKLRRHIKDFPNWNFVMECVRFGYGIEFCRLYEFCKKRKLKLRVVYLKSSVEISQRRIEKRMSKKFSYRRGPIEKGQFSKKNLSIQLRKLKSWEQDANLVLSSSKEVKKFEKFVFGE